MGGDGQALANKRSLLQKARAYVTAAELETGDAKEKTTQKARTVERWRHCALTLQPLEAPVVFDTAGNVFSKQSVIDYLLDRKERLRDGEVDDSVKFPLKKLSDVREVTNDDDAANEGICCPVTGYSISSGVHSFCGFWGCGHVVCASTLDRWVDVASQLDSECPLCGMRSFYVRLVLEDVEDATRQQSALRGVSKKCRKRQRQEDED